MAERKPGFYWVRAMSGWPWEVAHWVGRNWHLVGRLGHHQVAEVDERRIPDHD